MANRLRLSYREMPTYSLAAQKNSCRLFFNAKLHYPEDEEEVETATPRNFTVKLRCEGGLLLPEVWKVVQIK